MKKKSLLVFGSMLLVAVGVLFYAPSGFAEGADISGVLVEGIAGGDIPDSRAQLVRNDNGVSVTLRTTGLIPGDAYSVWWIVFDNPDFPTMALNTTGGIAGGTGEATFAGHLSAGEIPPVDGKSIVRRGDGNFDTTRTAKIKVVIRHHGPALPGVVPAQMSQLNGGCPPNACGNIQVAIFDGP